MSIFTGSAVALVTPFINNQVDYKALEKLIEWHLEAKTDAIVVCGTTGESCTLSKDEKKDVIAFTIKKVSGRVPVIAGTGGNNTQEAIEMSLFAEGIGADALLLVTPYYNKTTQRGLVAHYFAIADQVNIPIILYNVPSRTGLNIQPETVKELATHKNIVAIKEASGDLSQIAKIARLCPDGFDIYSGNDDQILPVLSLGGVGVISVVANILPDETHQICELYFNGMTNAATKLQLDMLDIINALFIETNPIPVKAALEIMGKINGELRLPLIPISDSNRELLIESIKNFNQSMGVSAWLS